MMQFIKNNIFISLYLFYLLCYNIAKFEFGELILNKKLFKRVIKDTLPVMSGYLVLGAGFGMIMHANGFGILWAVAMSFFIYAGSMQYAAVGLITGGASFLTVALTTVAVNARHIFYGISMVEKYKGTGFRKPYMMFALTDETYSLVCSSERDVNYYFWVSLFDQSYWIAGSALGSVLGSAVKINTEGIDFVLTALFVTIFIEQWLSSKKHFSAIAGVVITAVCLAVFGAESFLIPSMLIIAAVLLAGYKKGAALYE